MRIILILFFTLFSCQFLAAQENNDKSYNAISRDRVLMELNYTGWYNQQSEFFDTISTKWYNRGINLFFMWDIPLGESKDSRFAFAPGVGISNHNVYMNARPDFDTRSDSLSATAGQTVFRPITQSYRKSKLATTYIEAPFELRYRSKPDKFSRSWKVAVGIRLAYLIQANAKYKGTITNEYGASETVKTKDLEINGISKYRFGPSLRLGYGNVSLVGYFSLSDLFTAERGPTIQPFSIGITFNSF